MSEPLVSVLMPAYNHEKYIREAITSIINQTYQNIELLIIDDGSKDSTMQIIADMADACQKRFVRFEYKTQENSGVCITMNRLLAQAKGKYIFDIASDDCAYPQTIAKGVEFMEAHPDYVLVVGNNEYIDAESQVVGWDDDHNATPLATAKYKTFGDNLQHSQKDLDFSSADFGSYASLVRGNYIPNGQLLRKSTIDKIGGYTKEAPLEDWYLVMQFAKEGKFKYIDEILFSYRQHGTNTIKRKKYMHRIMYQTLKYEEKLVYASANPQLIATFMANSGLERVKFKLGKVLRLYKSLTEDAKLTILEIFGHKIVLKKKELRG